MSGAAEIRRLIPHGGAMCLLDRIVAWDERGVTLATSTHTAPDNALRRGGRLHAINLCEYGAQAMAVHGALASPASNRAAAPGMLVSLRDVVLSVSRVDSLAGELLVIVERLQGGGAAGLQYAFRVTHDGIELARGRAAVIEGKVPA